MNNHSIFYGGIGQIIDILYMVNLFSLWANLADYKLIFFSIFFSRKHDLKFYASYLCWRQLA